MMRIRFTRDRLVHVDEPLRPGVTRGGDELVAERPGRVEVAADHPGAQRVTELMRGDPCGLAGRVADVAVEQLASPAAACPPAGDQRGRAAWPAR
jgi:hypothetical protein